MSEPDSKGRRARRGRGSAQGRCGATRPAFDSFSALLLGITLLFGSQGYLMILGESGRLLCLGTGFSLVVGAALARHRFVPSRHVVFLLVSSILFVLLLLLGAARGHEGLDVEGVIFQAVAFAAFVAGGLLGARPQLALDGVPLRQALLLSAVAVPSIAPVLVHAERLALYGPIREIEGFDLNPVGLAYALANIVLVQFVVMVCGRGRIPRIVAAATLFLGVVGIASTLSRGAPLFVAASVGSVALLLWTKGQLRIGRVSAALIGVGALTVLMSSFFGQRLMLLERFELLEDRIEHLVVWAWSETVVDASAEERVRLQRGYLERWYEWVLFGAQGYRGYPHNQLLEWGVRFGLTGLALAAFFLFTFLRAGHLAAFRLHRLGPEVVFFLSLLVFSYLQSMTSLSLEMNRSLFLSIGYFVGMTQLGGLHGALSTPGDSAARGDPDRGLDSAVRSP